MVVPRSSMYADVTIASNAGWRKQRERQFDASDERRDDRRDPTACGTRRADGTCGSGSTSETRPELWTSINAGISSP